MRGYYLYGVVPSADEDELGPIGINGATVKIVPFKKLSAVVHSCEIDAHGQVPALNQPHSGVEGGQAGKLRPADEGKLRDSTINLPVEGATPAPAIDEKDAGQWIISHQDVVEKAWERFDVIAPSSFGTVIKGDDLDKITVKWLSDNYESFLSELKNLVGKAEYGVQIFWDIKKIGEEVVSGDRELLSLQDKIRSESAGVAYLRKKKMENILKSKLEEKAVDFFKSAYDTIDDMADGVVIEKLKLAVEGAQMLMNVSCLVARKDEKRLGSFLDELNNVGGYTVRFTGPWPPYSFVGKHGNME